MKKQAASFVYPQIIRKAILMVIASGLGLYTASSTIAANADTSTTDRTVLEDGVYLYGQSQNPDQIGSTYAVFSVENNQAVGAFYQPHSSFDCFSGQITPSRMEVTVVDSYTQSQHPYSIAMTTDTSIVAGTGAGAYTLENYHRLTPSAQDLDILNVCQQN